MSKKLFTVALVFSFVFSGRAYGASGCSYPGSLDSWADKSSGDQWTSSDVNSRSCAIEQLETRLNQLLNGKSAGQTITGGTGATESLTVSTTSNGSKGFLLIDTSVSTGADASSVVLKNGASVRFVNAAGSTTANLGVKGDANNDLQLIAGAGRYLLGGATVTTGANTGDVVFGNNKTLRWVNNAGTSGANFGVFGDSADNLNLAVPTTGDSINFGFAGTNYGWLQVQSGGMGVLFAAESTADHAAPSANQAVLYSKDNGSGKTQLCARFNTGAAQCFATEP